MELGRSTQGLAGAHVAGTFAGVMNEDDGDGMPALQFAKIGEQGGHFAADVFVDTMEANEGIENQQSGLQPGNGVVEGTTVGIEVDAQTGRGDDLDVEIGEVEAGRGADAVEATPHDVQRILGGIEQHPPGPLDGKTPQARGACSDGDGEIEGEEGFAALRLAADDADSFFRPQALDQPASFLWLVDQAMRWLDGQSLPRP
jgi:hypothetical protein